MNPPAHPTDLFAADYGLYGELVEDIAGQLAATAAQRDQQGGTALAERQLLRDSGLLALAVPRAHGGLEADWPLILRIVRRFAQADSSVAHLFGFQHLQVASVVLFGSLPQQQRYLGATVSERWFWGNAVNARDARLSVTATPQGYVLDGIKSFCSGARDSDVLNVSVALSDDPADRIYAVVPTARVGVTVNDDWDNMGQRQTDSGSVSFDQVLVRHDEVLGPPGSAGSVRATLRNLIGQLVLTEIYIGNAQGALADSLDYLRSQARPWPMSGLSVAHEDPYAQLRTGDLWIKLRSATALADQALEQFQQAWQAGHGLTADARGELSVAIAAARVHAGRLALDITADIFELMGARATTRRAATDRYWRNVRVHTLHDPLDYRQKGVGNWLLTGQAPSPFGYG